MVRFAWAESPTYRPASPLPDTALSAIVVLFESNAAIPYSSLSTAAFPSNEVRWAATAAMPNTKPSTRMPVTVTPLTRRPARASPSTQMPAIPPEHRPGRVAGGCRIVPSSPEPAPWIVMWSFLMTTTSS